ncbi:Gamma-glutamyl phosphate reductase [Trichinella spiralis]|uniref:Gamma-glutamyl phosphate reductase n=1 Tax=Trichinella spiralis TaxID=6334 RepID=A0ABR3K735_TRISP
MHCHDLETCNKTVACRKYNSTFESRLFLKEMKVIHHSNVGITGTIRRNLQRTTISYKHIQLHMEKNIDKNFRNVADLSDYKAETMVGRGGRWYNGVEWVVGGVGWMKE